MHKKALIGVAAAAAIAASVLIAPSSASANSASYVNPLATPVTTDFDITSVDLNYTSAGLTAVLHTQNLTPPEYSIQVIALSGVITTGGPGKAYGLVATSDGVTTEINGASYIDGANAEFAMPGATLTKDAGNTFTAFIPASFIPLTGGIFVAAHISDDDGDDAAAGTSYGSTIGGLGPILKEAQATTTTAIVTSPSQVYGSTPASLIVNVTPVTAVGTVQILDGANVVGAGLVSNGTAIVTLPTTLSSGSHPLVARFVPTDPTLFSTSDSVPVGVNVISIAKATKTSVVLSKKSQTFKKKAAKVSISVSGKPAGKVAIYDGKKKLKTVTLKKGKATYTVPKTLKKGKHTIKVVFTPTNIEAFKASSKTVKLIVKK